MKTEKDIIETAIDNFAGIEGSASAEELKSSPSHSGKGKGQLLIVYPGLLADQEFRLLVLIYSHFIIFCCGFANKVFTQWTICLGRTLARSLAHDGMGIISASLFSWIQIHRVRFPPLAYRSFSISIACEDSPSLLALSLLCPLAVCIIHLISATIPKMTKTQNKSVSIRPTHPIPQLPNIHGIICPFPLMPP